MEEEDREWRVEERVADLRYDTDAGADVHTGPITTKKEWKGNLSLYDEKRKKKEDVVVVTVVIFLLLLLLSCINESREPEEGNPLTEEQKVKVDPMREKW